MKRPRESKLVQAQVQVLWTDGGTVGTEIANTYVGGDDDKMKFESCSNHATDRDRSSKDSHKESNNIGSSSKQVNTSNEGCSLEGIDDVRHPLHRQKQKKQQQQQQGVKANILEQVHETGNKMNACEQQSGMKRARPLMEGDHQTSVSDIRSRTLLHHKRIQHVEPLDINYRSTPACLKLRDMLVSRLHLIAPTGRIQVVSSFIQSVFAK